MVIVIALLSQPFGKVHHGNNHDDNSTALGVDVELLMTTLCGHASLNQL